MIAVGMLSTVLAGCAQCHFNFAQQRFCKGDKKESKAILLLEIFGFLHSFYLRRWRRWRWRRHVAAHCCIIGAAIIVYFAPIVTLAVPRVHVAVVAFANARPRARWISSSRQYAISCYCCWGHYRPVSCIAIRRIEFVVRAAACSATAIRMGREQHRLY